MQVIPLTGTVRQFIGSAFTNSALASSVPPPEMGLYWQAEANTTNTVKLIMMSDFSGTSLAGGNQSSALATTSTNGGTNGLGSLAVTVGDRFAMAYFNDNWLTTQAVSAMGIIQ
jgi:hypothetical protein